MNNQIVYLSGDQKIYIKENEIFLNNFKINSNSLITGQNIISQSGSFSQIETENLLGQNIAGNQIYCNNLDIGSFPALNLIQQKPLSGSSPGKAGQCAVDSSHFYVCKATDSWIRIPLNSNW